MARASAESHSADLLIRYQVPFEQPTLIMLAFFPSAGIARPHGKQPKYLADELPKADDAPKENGDNGAFHLPCCRETLAVTVARDHCCGVRPTIPSGEPPPGAPAAAGHFSARSIGRACKGLRVPDCYPHLQSVPPRSAVGTPSHRISEKPVRLFMARTLAQRPFCLLECPLPTSCRKRATPAQVKLAPVEINWNEFSSNALFALVGQFRSAGGLVLLSGRSWGLRFPAARLVGLITGVGSNRFRIMSL